MGSLTKVRFRFGFIPHFIYLPFPLSAVGALNQKTQEKISCFSQGIHKYIYLKVGKKAPLD